MHSTVATILIALSGLQNPQTEPGAGGGGTLVGFATVPADTFESAGGHKSGQFIGEEMLNGRRPPFERQPIQGISAVVAGDEPGTFLALSDNGYGKKANSADYLLSAYRVRPEFRRAENGEIVGSGEVQIELAFRLSDPDKRVPWPIVADRETYPNSDIPVPPEVRERRLLTGADFDVESMVRLPDGTFWIGDEFGPFLLHFDKEGKLLEPPVELPGEGMHSPDHPTKDPAKAKVQRSGGFEGITTFSHMHGVTELAGVLEKPLIGEEGVLGFRRYLLPNEGISGDISFSLSPGADAIGEVDGVGWSNSYLEPKSTSRTVMVIERDGSEGADAMHKQLAILTTRWQMEDPTRRSESRVATADLLNLGDPHDLNGDGQRTFRFPFLTPESVLPVDERTVLVINDNNYPFTSGRTPGVPDPTEFILIRFARPLAELASE